MFLILMSRQGFSGNGKNSFGMGVNAQWHRIRITEHGLSFMEIQKRSFISPSLFFATKINSRLELGFDISYIRFKKTCQTNINFHKADPGDEITASTYTRFPIFTSKLNYQMLKKGKFEFDVMAGLTYSFQITGLTMKIDYKSVDSTINCQYIGESPLNFMVNPLLGLQAKLNVSKHFNLRLNIFNVIGGKKYIYRDQYFAIDKNGDTRKLEYGLYGGFSCIDFKLVYNY